MTTTVTTELRDRAAQRFAELGWPTPRIEAWKYTSLAPVEKTLWHSDSDPKTSEVAETLAGRAVLELQFVNGHLVRTTGEQFASIDEIGRHVDFQQNALVALNTAHMQDGARIAIPANRNVEGFIHLLFAGSGDSVWSHPRNVIHVGRGSQVAIVETYVGTGRYFTNAVTEIVAEDGAVVDHYRLEC